MPHPQQQGARLLPLLGVSGRAPVEAERKYLTAWAELGFEGIPETRANVPKGTDLFEKLSDADKEKILGKAGFQAYKAGDVRLEDFVGSKASKQWGTMRYTRSLRDILGTEEAKKWMAEALKVKQEQ